MACFALVALCWPALSTELEWRRSFWQTSEWWRVLCGHLVHYDLQHFLIDTITLLLLGSVCERIDAHRARWTIAISALSISFCLLFFAPGVAVYRGLSGIDAALFALLCVEFWHRPRKPGKPEWSRMLAAIPFLLLLAKITFELLSGSALFATSDAFMPVPMAHLVGALTGWLIGMSRTRPLRGFDQNGCQG